MSRQAVRVRIDKRIGGENAVGQVASILTATLSVDTSGLDWYASPRQIQRLRRVAGVTVDRIEGLPQGCRAW